MKNIRIFFNFMFCVVLMLFLHACVDQKFPSSTDQQLSFNDTLSYDTLSDVDGNTYHTIRIGTQTWMASNLKVSKFRNGDVIETTSSGKNISSKSEPKNQWGYKGEEKNAKKYGRLYTWHAVTDNRNIAPEGWHVATEEDWDMLAEYVSDNTGVSRNLLKALAGTTEWKLDDTKEAIGDNLLINNSSGFTALPSGRRYPDGTYNGLNQFGYFWTTQSTKDTDAFYRVFGYSSTVIYKTSANKSFGFSVRCVKDN